MTIYLNQGVRIAVKIAVLGEAMLELVPTSDRDSRTEQMRHLVASFAGDTYNSAIYLARLGAEVAYYTLVGDDPYSRLLISNTRNENIDVELIKALPERQLGLYMIRNLAGGEREFRYWRSEAPAREMFAAAHFGEQQRRQLFNFPYLYLSGITVAILLGDGRQRLLEFLQDYGQQGGKICFDSNYRPRLWQSKDEAQRWTRAVLELSDMALLTLDDQRALFNLNSEQEAVNRCLKLPCAEVVIKRGHLATLGRDQESDFSVDTPAVANVIDTTGAGDSFNAGYIHARLNGKNSVDSVQQANKLAALVIQHRGAVIPKDQFNNLWPN